MIHRALKYLVLISLAALAASCVSSNTLQSEESLAISSDFKVITPTKPAQEKQLKSLPNGKLSRVSVGGKTYYILPDHAAGNAYIGGPKQYANYQQLGQARAYANEANQDAVVEANLAKDAYVWSGWDGWAGWVNDGDGALASERSAVGWY
ncbi:hypothetical protein [Haloferula sp.]|uniref:hypothetical protein n=1 Tax=Haloferula sp. TaxID=2497595 RepID=UPI003C735AD2